jgi:hypothetical protein
VQPSDPNGFVTVPFFSGMRLNWRCPYNYN